MAVEVALPGLTELTEDDLCSLGGGPSVVEEEAPLLSGDHVPLRLVSLSPLRYPGSKRKMLPAIRQLIVDNVPRPELLVEPFCGGASVSLGLLETDAVERVLLADFDPLVAAFWQVATEDTDALVKAMRKERITVENWDRWRKYRPRTPLNRAMKCLFLNRTTFSGIIGGHPGPIGGRTQANYRIDCRFDKDAIEARLRNIQSLCKEGRIVGAVEDCWHVTFRRAHDIAASLGLKADSVVFYLDPPYIEKANDLYELPFTDQNHRALAQYLDNTERWVLSYDKEPLVLGLYRGMQGVREYRVTHHYTMTGNRKCPVPGREVLFTNLPYPPKSALPPPASPGGDL